MFPKNPELEKIMDMVKLSDYGSVEDYVFTLLNQVADENLFLEIWINDTRRVAIRFGLSVLYSDPSKVEDPDEIGAWLAKASEFIEFLHCAETNYGVEGWANIFNSVAQKHYLDNVFDFNLLDFFTDVFLTTATKIPKDMSLDDFLDNDNMFAVMDIPDIEGAWQDMVSSGKMFGQDFENEWE